MKSGERRNAGASIEPCSPERGVNKHQSFIEMLDAWWGGGITTLFGAFLGRFMFHAGEVRASRRKLFGREVLWELPIAVGMAVIGESLAAWLGLSNTTRVGLIAALAYLGPRGAEVMLMKYFPPKQ